MNKGNSCSNRKARNSPMKQGDDLGGNKSHMVSTHLKTSQDLYSNIYKLPLKEIFQQRRQEETSYSQKKQKVSRNQPQIHAHTDFKTKHNLQKSSRKMSMYYPPESSRQLRTDRSSKEFIQGKTFELKRIKTQLQNINEQDYMKTVQHGKSTHKGAEKEYVNIKFQDIMGLLAKYSKLKSRNIQLSAELDFYYKELGNAKEQSCSVLKTLSA